jgi:hypothetical protein
MKARMLVFGLVSFFLTASSITMAQYSRDEKFGYFADRTMVASQTMVLNESLVERISEICGIRGVRLRNHGSP